MLGLSLAPGYSATRAVLGAARSAGSRAIGKGFMGGLAAFEATELVVAGATARTYGTAAAAAWVAQPDLEFYKWGAATGPSTAAGIVDGGFDLLLDLLPIISTLKAAVDVGEYCG